MTTSRRGAVTPEGLGERFAALAASGDLDGIMELYAADAVVSLPRGREAAGSTAIRVAFAAALAAGVDLAFEAAVTRAVVSGPLAMTSMTTEAGVVRTQVARREADGHWVWIRDGSRLRDVEAAVASTTDLPVVA